MNSDDGLMPNMQVDPPADVLDLAIDALAHAIPVFDDRQLHRGVNTRYAREFASFLSGLAQDIASSTQFTRQKEIIPANPKLAIVKEMTAWPSCQPARENRETKPRWRMPFS